MIQETINNQCRACGKELKGRSDKRYCDERCRNYYHNRLDSADKKYIQKTNNVLKKNRRILQDLLKEETTENKVSREELAMRGFCFQAFTGCMVSKRGSVTYACYDFELGAQAGGQYRIRRRPVSFFAK